MLFRELAADGAREPEPEATASTPLKAAAPAGSPAWLGGLKLLAAVALGAAALAAVTVVAVRSSRAGAGGSSPPPLPLRVEQLMVHGGADPNTQFTVSWAVPRSAAGSASAASTASTFSYSLPGGSSAPASAPVTCTQYGVLDADEPYYASPYLCSAAALVPAAALGTRVAFRAGDAASGYASGAVATAPQPGVPGARLAVLGDLGTTADSAATLAGIAAAGPFAGLLFLGDLSYADGNQSVWDDWGRLYSTLSAMDAGPTFFLPGNHVSWRPTAPQPVPSRPFAPLFTPLATPPHPLTAFSRLCRSGLTLRQSRAITGSPRTAITRFSPTWRACTRPLRAAPPPPTPCTTQLTWA